jgi:predicted AlkP superfamily pyrophosphatase or phosphodiesterase
MIVRQKRIVLFFLIDALGWEYVKASGLLDKSPELYGNEVRTILGYSSAAEPTMLTGRYPEEHGRWNLLRYSPETSPFAWTRILSFVPDRLLANRYVHKAISVISKRIAKAEGYFSTYAMPVKHLRLFDICETRNIYKPGGIGGSTSVFDYFVDRGIPYKSYSYHDGEDETLLEKAKEDIQTGPESVYFLYLAGLDAYLHKHGKNQELGCRRVEWYFKQLQSLVEVAKSRANEVRYFVFSDHGMTPVTERYDLIAELRKRDIGPERDYLSVFDSTMARFWFKNPQLREDVESFLEQCPAGRILDDAELKKMHIFFPDSRYGELIFLMNPGTLIYPSFFGSYAPAGMHGFDPDDPHSSAAYLSNVADHSPRELRDIYDVITTEAALAAGLTPTASLGKPMS